MLAFSVVIILKFSIHIACFSTAKKNIEGIKFIFITKDELTKTQESLEDRLQRQLQFQVLGVIMNSYHLVRIPLL